MCHHAYEFTNENRTRLGLDWIQKKRTSVVYIILFGKIDHSPDVLGFSVIEAGRAVQDKTTPPSHNIDQLPEIGLQLFAAGLEKQFPYLFF